MILRAAERHMRDFGWLRTFWLFSFDDYYDPGNVGFGALRVFNDDVIAPGKGFPMHPHADMEIVTLVLSGELSHEDSTGGKGVIRAGEVQHMSAGTGIVHAERNAGKEPCHLYQLWFLPMVKGLRPSYGQTAVSLHEDALTLLASSSGGLRMQSDARLHRGRLRKGKRLVHNAAKRGTFIYLSAGMLEVNRDVLSPGDQARLTDARVELLAREDSDFVLVDVRLS